MNKDTFLGRSLQGREGAGLGGALEGREDRVGRGGREGRGRAGTGAEDALAWRGIHFLTLLWAG